MDLSTARTKARSAGTATRKKFDIALWWLAVIPLTLILVTIPVAKFSNYMLSDSKTRVATGTTPAHYVNAPVVIPMGQGKTIVTLNNQPVIVRDFNTSDDCPGDVVLEPLSNAKQPITKVGCFLYWRVIKGRILLSGYFLGEVEDGPEGGQNGNRLYTDVRAKEGTAVWKRIRCAGPKINPNDEKWAC